MSRQAFENRVGKGPHFELIPKGAPFAGEYIDDAIQTRWEEWQAATNAALERAGLIEKKEG